MFFQSYICLRLIIIVILVSHMSFVGSTNCNCRCPNIRSNSFVCDELRKLQTISNINENIVQRCERHLPFIERFSTNWETEVKLISRELIKEESEDLYRAVQAIKEENSELKIKLIASEDRLKNLENLEIQFEEKLAEISSVLPTVNIMHLMLENLTREMDILKDKINAKEKPRDELEKKLQVQFSLSVNGNETSDSRGNLAINEGKLKSLEMLLASDKLSMNMAVEDINICSIMIPEFENKSRDFQNDITTIKKQIKFLRQQSIRLGDDLLDERKARIDLETAVNEIKGRTYDGNTRIRRKLQIPQKYTDTVENKPLPAKTISVENK